MSSDPTPKQPGHDQPIKALKQALRKNEAVKERVAECADELSNVNVALARELDMPSSPSIQTALANSEAVEVKVREASSELSIVNQALEVEVGGRHVLEHELALATEQKDAARHAAFHDPLTGLPNRALFIDRLHHGLAHARRHGWTLSVMFLDLDGFKQINDTLGHAAGDRALQAIAHRLAKNVRDDDTVSRFGGDEFLFLLMEAGETSDLASIAQMLVLAVQEPCEILVDDSLVLRRIHASIGIAVFPSDGDTVEELLEGADLAMYRAKRAGIGFAFARE